MHCTWWVTKATDIHSEYVILIAFPQQQWLCKHVSYVTFIHTLPVLNKTGNVCININVKNINQYSLTYVYVSNLSWIIDIKNVTEM